MVHAITHANNWEVMWPAVHIGAYVGGGIFHDPSEFLMWDRSDAKFNRKLSAGTTRNFLADRRGNCNYDVTQVCVVSCHDAQLCLTCGILVWCHSLSVRLGQRKASGYRETRALNPDHTLESPIDLPAAGSHGSPETTMLSLMSFWHHVYVCALTVLTVTSQTQITGSSPCPDFCFHRGTSEENKYRTSALEPHLRCFKKPKKPSGCF